MDKKQKISIITFIIGIILAIAGAVVLVVNIMNKNTTDSAEFLVATGAWQRQDQPEVIWNFTEIGKGSLTSNNHTNDYDFVWMLDGDKIKIKTNWLYEKEDEFTYYIDQGAKTLTLKSDNEEYIFKAAN